jgi:succinate-semialdehyde dehydrogenase / glutarate-semialdehyde dehydrogenase
MKQALNLPLLEETRGFIAGQWRDAQSGRTLAVTNPATGEHLADVPDMAEEETAAAVDAAREGMDPAFPLEERSRWLGEIADRLIEHKKELGRIITLEQGKPLKESQTEVEYAAGFFRFFAGRLSHLEPETVPETSRPGRWTIHRRPAGVAALITPWNFPLAMLAKKLSAAIGAGCGVVARPAGRTPLTAIALWRLIQPITPLARILNLVLGRAGPIGDALCRHRDVRVLSFTGSTEVGRLLMEKCAPQVKRLSLELGGNAPFIVMEDADIEQAADQLIANKFRAGGQTCVCANRVYAHRDVARAFAEAVGRRVAKLRVGNGLEPETDIGPLIDRDAFDKVAQHVRDALERGADRVVGDDPSLPVNEWGCFYPPTVLTGITQEMRLSSEETFGPVVAIGEFDSQERAIRLANATIYGLAAYLFTADPQRAERMAAGLQFGHVGINTGSGPTPEAPFGGMKQSGFGREGGVEGLYEFCEIQTVVMSR